MRKLACELTAALSKLGFRRSRSRVLRFRSEAQRRLRLEALETRVLLAADFLVTTLNDEFNLANNDVSLREALHLAANDGSTTDNDIIAFDPDLFSSGHQTLTISYDDPVESGTEPDQLVVDSDVTIQGPGAELLSINGYSGYGVTRVLAVVSGVTATIQDLTITGGDATVSGMEVGGGILNEGNLAVLRSVIAGNSAKNTGGGIHSTGTLTIDQSVISDNSTTAVNFDDGGGGIYSTGTLTVSDTIFRENTAVGGGGIRAESGHVTIVRSEFVDNTAWVGGGLAVVESSGLEIDSSTFAANTANGSYGYAYGGGIYAEDTDVTISNSTVSGNYGGISSGGISFYASQAYTAVLTNVTVVNNESGGSIGAGGINTTANMTTTLHNSIVAGNYDSVGPDDLFGNFDSSSSSNLIGYDPNLNNGINHDPTGTGNLVGGENSGPAIDPLLAPLGHYGGTTRTHALLENSPAIDAGSATSAQSYDQRGVGFSRKIGDFVDIGAFESGNNIELIVNTPDDELDTLGPADYMEDLSLREALYFASLLDGDETIRFADELFSTGSANIALTDQLVVGSNVAIAGPGADSLTITGSGAKRVFNISTGTDVTLSGLTITEGHAVSGKGGGIYNQGDLELIEVVVYDNQSDQEGGGIYTKTGTLTLINSTVDSNDASWSGGGIFGLTPGYAAVSIFGSTISRNESNASGGGVIVWGGGSGSYTDGALTVVNSTISGNQTANYGGGIRSQWQDTAGSVVIVNTTITENDAGSDGGGISHVAGIQPVVQNTIIAQNTAPSYANALVQSGYSGSSGDNLIGGDPRLAPLGDYGGPTETHAPLPDSPAINAGDSDVAVNAGLLFDQRGLGYERILGDAVDIGATEAWLKGDYGGVIEIYGTDGSDSILVSSTDISHSAFGELEVDLSEVDEVRVYGYGGDDYLAVDAAFASIAKLCGGDGNDELRGGAAADLLFGETGDDKLFGYGGDDALDGGEGNDFLQGDAGNDAYVGGAGHDFYEPDGEDDPHAPELDPISNITVRNDQGLAFRVIADDVEDEYSELDFSVVIDTQVIPSNWYSVVDGVFRLVQNGWEAGTYETTITVEDDDELTDEVTFDITFEDYNLAPPYTFAPLNDFFSPGHDHLISFGDSQTDYVDGTITLVSGPPNASVYLDQTYPSSPQWYLSWFPPGPAPTDYPFIPEVMIDEQWYSPYNFVFEVSDDGAPGQTTRTRQFELHGGQGASITFDGYYPFSQHAANDDIVDAVKFGMLAKNDHMFTNLGTTLNSNVNQLGNPDILALDAVFQLVGDAPDHALSWDWDEYDGSFTYAPEPDFEGVVTFQYRLHSEQGWYELSGTSPPYNYTYNPYNSNTATVTIEVGKAVRANISTGVPEEREDVAPGKYVEINFDDDNGNGIPDRDELATVANEDDLVAVNLSYWLRDDVYEADYTASLYSPSEGTLRVWTSPTKQEQIIPYTPTKDGTKWLLSEMPATVYVEAIAAGNKTLTLQINGPSTSLFADMLGPLGGGVAAISDSDSAVFAAGAKLWQMYFTHTHTIASDVGSGGYTGSWLDSNLDGDADDSDEGDVLTPAAYTRSRSGQDEYASTTTQFIIDPAAVTGNVFIRGTGPDGINIPNTQATVTDDVASIVDVQATTPFVNTIKYYDKFVIDWEISLDGGATYISGGQSENPLYLTWSDPELPTLTWTVLHTATVAADGVGGTVGTNDDLVLEKIWDKIATLQIERVEEPMMLSYYGYRDNDGNGIYTVGDTDYNDLLLPPADLATNYIDLVMAGNGNCFAWVSFMVATLWSQGLTEVNSQAIYAPTVTPKDAKYFAVKNWDKNGPGPTWIVQSDLFHASVTGENMPTAGPGEAVDAPGVPGQGNAPNPPPAFDTHGIILIGGKYYDPSYGIGLYTDRKKYELDAFEGLITIDLQLPGHRLHESPPDDGNAANHDDEINNYDETVPGSDYIPN